MYSAETALDIWSADPSHPEKRRCFDVAPDGSRFLIRKPVADPGPNAGFHVVLDGFAELRQPEAPASR